MSREPSAITASLYYRLVSAASLVLRTNRSASLLARLLSGVRNAGSCLGLNRVNQLFLGHLRRIFSDRTEEELESIVRGYWFRHQASLVALFRPKRWRIRGFEDSIEWVNRDLLDTALDEGRGLLLLVPHFGDERTLHILLALAGYPVHVISSRYADSPPFVRRSKLAVASSLHHVAFPDQSPRWMFDTLGSGELIHIAPTAYGGPKGDWVRNFGVPVLASATPRRLYERTGCSLLMGYNRILPGMRYRLEFQSFDATGMGTSFTQRLFQRIEEKALEVPGQYDWMHLTIRHRETNTIARLGYVPREEPVLEREAIPEDSDPGRIIPFEEIGSLLASAEKSPSS